MTDYNDGKWHGWNGGNALCIQRVWWMQCGIAGILERLALLRGT